MSNHKAVVVVVSTFNNLDTWDAFAEHLATALRDLDQAATVSLFTDDQAERVDQLITTAVKAGKP